MSDEAGFEAAFPGFDFHRYGDGRYQSPPTYWAWQGWKSRGLAVSTLTAEIESLRKWYADSHRIIDEWDTKCAELKARIAGLEEKNASLERIAHDGLTAAYMYGRSDANRGVE